MLHINNAMHKLGAVTKHQAVLQALRPNPISRGRTGRRGRPPSHLMAQLQSPIFKGSQSLANLLFAARVKSPLTLPLTLYE